MYDTELCHLGSFHLYPQGEDEISIAGSTKLPQMASTQSLSGSAKVISMPSKAINTLISSRAHFKRDPKTALAVVGPASYQNDERSDL